MKSGSAARLPVCCAYVVPNALVRVGVLGTNISESHLGRPSCRTPFSEWQAVSASCRLQQMHLPPFPSRP